MLIQLGLFAVCAVPVFALMLLCSVWTSFASPDPYPAQMFWIRVGDVLGFPTAILPKQTHGLIQFSVVLLFWSAALRFTFFLIFSAAAARHTPIQQNEANTD